MTSRRSIGGSGLGGTPASGRGTFGSAGVRPILVKLAYQMPFDWPAMLAFYAVRAVAGIERITDGTYVRSIRIGGKAAVIEVRDQPEACELIVTLRNAPPGVADEVARRLRRAFDIHADIARITSHLSRDPFLAPLVAARPAVRTPSHWEPFETAVRAILGQQVTLAAAARLSGRLVERAGPRIAGAMEGGPDRLFPEAKDVLAADLSDMGMPGARIRALQAVSEAFIAEPGLFARSGSIEETVERLSRIKGIGPWTAQYIALRACGEPDAFPASDVGLLRGALDAQGQRPTPKALEARAEAWRPWRSYAAQHIWAADADQVVAGGGSDPRRTAAAKNTGAG